MPEKYKVWIHIEKITDEGEDGESYEDVGLPEIAGEFDTEEEAEELVEELMGWREER